MNYAELEYELEKAPLSRKAKNRLGRLADLLEEDADNPRGVTFNMHTFGYSTNPEGKLAWNCGTQCCALGLAAISGLFKGYGLGHKPKQMCEGIGIEFVLKGVGDQHPYVVGAAIFDISYELSKMLFGGHIVNGSGAETEMRMANLLREMCEGVYNGK